MPASEGGQLRQWPAGSQTPLRAVYGWHVSSGTTECARYSCTIDASPPSHPPADRPGGADALGAGTQLSSACRLSRMSGALARLAIFIRSSSAAAVA